MTVSAVEKFNPYSTTTQFGLAVPPWLTEMDARRINAYQIYEQIYWSVPETFELTLRGQEDKPIYVPTGRTIVDTTNRFVCADPAIMIDPDVGGESEQEEMRNWMTALLRRERFWSQFNSNKRFGFIRGDWVWHVIGDEAKPDGRRITIETVDPAAYFPVTHPDNPDRIIGVHLVEQIVDDEDQVRIKRQTYRRGVDPLNNDGSDTTIYNDIAIYEMEHWQALDDKALIVIKPPTPLPPEITSIPVYHIKNMVAPGDPFGSSELRGLERIMSAVNQAISDEEMILALEGLGMYETDGGPPRDEAGNVTDWILGPGKVVEHQMGSKFGRVSGVTTVAPMQDHLAFLIKNLREASGTPDAAISLVNVQVAESGIARLLSLAPMLAKADERETEIAEVLMNMFFDLTAWLNAYEGLGNPCVALPVFGDPLPDDRDARFKEIMTIFTAQLADADWARSELSKIGYVFPENMTQAVLTEQAARAVATDPFAARAAGELDTEEGAPQ